MSRKYNMSSSEEEIDEREEEYESEYEIDEYDPEEREEHEGTDDETDSDEYEEREENQEREEQYENYRNRDGNVTPYVIQQDEENDNPYLHFSNMYDLFSIHTSNNHFYRTRDIEEIELNRNYQSYLDENGNENIVHCPICNEQYNVSHLMSHIIYQHYELYLSLNVIVNPSITLDDIHQTAIRLTNMSFSQMTSNLQNRTDALNTIHHLMYSNDDDYTPSYEDLLSLCEQIGYHKPGIKNVEEAAPLLEQEEREELVKEDDTCRICLECLQSSESLRKTKNCNHIFCSPCIEKWLEENKLCPLCNTELSIHTQRTETQQETAFVTNENRTQNNIDVNEVD